MTNFFKRWVGATLTSLLLAMLVAVGFVPIATLAAPAFANGAFGDVWSYSDGPVEGGEPNLGRGYTWGPTSVGIKQEAYREASGGTRPVQYFDKARMEATRPSQGEYDVSNVTNGLLTVELTTGRRQDGDNTFTQLPPSYLSVAGDALDPGNPAPRYGFFGPEVSTINPSLPNRNGQIINQAKDQSGANNTITPPAQVKYNYYDPTTHHNVADVFYRFMFQQGTVYAYGRGAINSYVYTNNPLTFVFGLPVSEAYWTRAKVGGVEKAVLVQLFQRRILTYTPSNPDPYKVEMGNIGQHYFQWRYGGTSGSAPTPGVSKTVLGREDGSVALRTSLQGGDGIAIAQGSTPIFSPDASRVAFIGDSNGELSNLIQSVALDGSDKRNHCTVSGKYFFSLIRYAPDGNSILVGQQTVGVHQLFSCNLATGKLNGPLTLNGTTQLLPTFDWTKDGRHAVWQYPDNANNDGNLYYGDPNNLAQGQAVTNQENSTSGYYEDATLSPDGKTIAIAGDALFFVSVPGQTSPLAGKVFFKGLSPSRLVWSSNGSEILVVVSGPDGNELRGLNPATGQTVSTTLNVNWADWASQ